MFPHKLRHMFWTPLLYCGALDLGESIGPKKFPHKPLVFVTLLVLKSFLLIATTNNHTPQNIPTHPITSTNILLNLPRTNMCPSCNGDVTPTTNGNGQVNGTNGYGEHTPHNPRRQPFASVGDYLSNVSNFRIIESTLREGEQVTKHPRF